MRQLQLEGLVLRDGGGGSKHKADSKAERDEAAEFDLAQPVHTILPTGRLKILPVRDWASGRYG